MSLQHLVAPPTSKFPAIRSPPMITEATSSLTGMADDAPTTPSTVSTIMSSVHSPTASCAGTIVPNPTIDLAIQRLVPFNMKIKDLMGTAPPPTMEDSTPMCLSYHVNCGCFSNCRRKNNHDRTLSPLDQTRLANYIADRLAQMAPAPAAATNAPP
jgi:hypothetical protein